MEKIPVTSSGFTAMESELKDLKLNQRPAVITAIAVAREHGDLSENAEYHAAREKQGFIEGRIRELEDRISRANVINVSELTGNNIKFGATVTLVDEETEEEKKYQIVGDIEADVKSHKLSIASPLAKAMIGKTQGDSIEVNTPKGTKYYEVEQIAYV